MTSTPTKVLLTTIFAALLVFLSSRFSIPLPGTDVPQSAQTLVIVLVAALLPGYTGVYAVLLYLLSGLAGLPVFSGGGSGMSHLLGPTGGYLFGFFIAAFLIAKIKSLIEFSKPVNLVLVMIIAHVFILFFGWLWLSQAIGVLNAYAKGVSPFLLGGLVKSVIATGIILAIQYFQKRNVVVMH